METKEDAQGRDVNIFPLTKWKRILAFLADAAILFLCSFAFFHLAYYPIISTASSLSSSQEEYVEAMNKRDNVLYGNSLLFYNESSSDKTAASFSSNLSYTCDCYVKFLCGKGESKYDVFSNYYSSIKGDQSGYLTFLKQRDSSTSFFDFSSSPKLADTYIEEFLPYFEEGNSPTKKGEEDYSSFQKEFFLPSYSVMLEDIKANDLVYEGVSYKEEQSIVEGFKNKVNVVVCSSAGGAYLTSLLLLQVIVPLISKTRKTLGLIFLKEERVDANRLIPIKRPKLILTTAYTLFFSSFFVFLLPWPVISFNELFTIPALWIISLISLILDLVSLGFLLFDSLDRTLSDRLTLISYIDEESMDAIYRAKGYGE